MDKSCPIDITIENHGTLYLLRPHTEPAHSWITENIDPSATFYGGALVVEPRYVEDIAIGMSADGLIIRT